MKYLVSLCLLSTSLICQAQNVNVELINSDKKSEIIQHLTDYTQHSIDGVEYPVAYQSGLIFTLELIQLSNKTYITKPCYCTVRTDYTGESGVYYNLETRNSSNYDNFPYIHSNEIKYTNIESAFNTLPWEQPTIYVANDGCSSYRDGDICNKTVSTIYVKCTYTE